MLPPASVKHAGAAALSAAQHAVRRAGCSIDMSQTLPMTMPQSLPSAGPSLTTPAAEDVPLWLPKGWRSSPDVSAALLMPAEPVVTVNPVTPLVAEEAQKAAIAVGHDAEVSLMVAEAEREVQTRQGIGWTPSFFSLAQISSGGAKWSLAAVQGAIQPQADDASTSASGERSEEAGGCVSPPDTLEPQWALDDLGRPAAEGSSCAEEVQRCDSALAFAVAPAPEEAILPADATVQVLAGSTMAVAPTGRQERETPRESARLQQYHAEVSELRRQASEEATERQRLETIAASATQRLEDSEARVAELTEELGEAQRHCTFLDQRLAEQQETHAALKEDLEQIGRKNITLEARLEEERQLRLSAEQRVSELTLKVSCLGDSPDASRVTSVGEAELPATDLQLIGDWSSALATGYRACPNRSGLGSSADLSSPPVGSARSTSFAEPSVCQGQLSATTSARVSWISGSSPSRGSRSGAGNADTPSTDVAVMGPATASVDLTAPLPTSDGLPCMGVLSMRDLSEIKALKKPPPPIRMLMEVCCLLFNIEPMKLPDEKAPRGWRLDYWEPARRSLLSDPFFLSKLRGFDDEVQPAQRAKIRRYFQDPEFTADRVRNCSKAAYELYAWVSSLLAQQQSTDGCSPRQ